MVDVYKFGGSSVSQPTACLNVLQDSLPGDVVVVSAPAGVTDALLAGHETQLSTGIFPVFQFNRVKTLFQRAYQGSPRIQEEIEKEFSSKHEESLSSRIKARDSLREKDQDYRARIASFGEHLNSILFTMYLTENRFDARSAPMRDVVQFDDHSLYERVESLYEDTSDTLIRDYVHNGFNGITVFGGFYTHHKKTGRIILLGRGGSDLTQTLIARAVHARKAINCTDVAGIKPIDPRLLSQEERGDMETIPHLSYDLAQEVARSGAKVLHPRCIEPLRQKCIPLIVRSTFDAGLTHTVIDRNEPNDPGPIAVTGKRGPYNVLRFRTAEMAGGSGYYGMVTRALRETDVEVMANSNVSITAVYHTDTLVDPSSLTELQRSGTVHIANDTSVVALVGNKLNLRTTADALAVIADVGVDNAVVSQGHHQSIWVAVPERKFKDVQVALYQQIIKKRGR